MVDGLVAYLESLYGGTWLMESETLWFCEILVGIEKWMLLVGDPSVAV
jgi:hypothetical protein